MSPRPAVAPFTDELYGALPEVYRTADEGLDWPLLRYLSLLGDQGDELEVLHDRIDLVRSEEGGAAGDASDLVDPALADAAWLPWLGQHVGVFLERTPPRSFAMSYGDLGAAWPTYAALDAAFDTYGAQEAATTPDVDLDVAEAEARTRIASASAGWRVGSAEAIRDAVEPFLTGTRRVDFVRNLDGDPFKLGVHTYAAESPAGAAWATAAEAVRSVAVELVATVVAGASYGQLSAEFATYAALDAGIGTYAEQSAHVPPPEVP